MIKKINLGVVGSGIWGQAHAEVFATHHQSNLVAVCDLDFKKAENLAKKYGVKAYKNIEDMLSNEEIEAVGIATPDYAHKEPTIAAAKAGKDILLEKPLATTIEDTNAIVDAVKSNKVNLMVDFHARWSPPFYQAKKSIQEGKLGEIISGYYRLNDVLSVPMNMLPWADKSSILWFLGSHSVDTLRWFFEDEVEKVYSVSRSGVLESKGIDVPDIYQTILEFKSGKIATIENNWIVPNTQPNVNDMKLNILGSEGMIDMDLTNHGVIRRYMKDTHDYPDVFVKPKVYGKNIGFAYEAIRDFVECLAEGKNFKVDLEDGIKVTKVILAIMESAKSGQPENIVY